MMQPRIKLLGVDKLLETRKLKITLTVNNMRNEFSRPADALSMQKPLLTL
jgi:hypothetical protein